MTDAGDLAAAPAAAAPEPTGWEDPPRVARTNTAPVLSVDGITGPLDWLLDMARAKKIDLARLSIGALIGQFAAALPDGQQDEIIAQHEIGHISA